MSGGTLALDECGSFIRDADSNGYALILMPGCMSCSGKCGHTLAVDKKPETAAKGKKGKKEKA